MSADRIHGRTTGLPTDAVPPGVMRFDPATGIVYINRDGTTTGWVAVTKGSMNFGGGSGGAIVTSGDHTQIAGRRLPTRRLVRPAAGELCGEPLGQPVAQGVVLIHIDPDQGRR